MCPAAPGRAARVAGATRTPARVRQRADTTTSCSIAGDSLPVVAASTIRPSRATAAKGQFAHPGLGATQRDHAALPESGVERPVDIQPDQDEIGELVLA